jgi:signal transduction histidine kinase
VLLEDVVAGHRELSKERRVDLDLEVEGACTACVNPESFGHIVGNLVNNALKYSEPGGWVQVRAWSEPVESLVEVEDNGPGIDPVYQERIFERFFRVDSGRSRASGGSGLGLAIVKHLCRASGASVSLHSIPGHGSTFTLRFPR